MHSPLINIIFRKLIIHVITAQSSCDKRNQNTELAQEQNKSLFMFLIQSLNDEKTFFTHFAINTF